MTLGERGLEIDRAQLDLVNYQMNRLRERDREATTLQARKKENVCAFQEKKRLFKTDCPHFA